MKTTVLKSTKENDGGFVFRVKRDFAANKGLYALMLLPVIWYTVFCYGPMYGLLIAFQKYNIRLGVFGSEWAGLYNFKRFFLDPYFGRDLFNTIYISLSSIIFSFPLPIILALLINELRNKFFAKCVQTVTYIPHFISLVVICGMVRNFVAADGVITNIFTQITGKQFDESMLNFSQYFTTIFVGSGIWQGVGWGSIIYTAAISGVDAQLYEAATIDGAGRFRQMLSVTLPAIAPTIIIMFILRMGDVLTVSYEKILLLINSLNAERAEVLSYYVYKRGIAGSDYGISTAAGFFNSVVNLVFVIATNYISKRVSDINLW